MYQPGPARDRSGGAALACELCGQLLGRVVRLSRGAAQLIHQCLRFGGVPLGFLPDLDTGLTQLLGGLAGLLSSAAQLLSTLAQFFGDHALLLGACSLTFGVLALVFGCLALVFGCLAVALGRFTPALGQVVRLGRL
jgi:hypothetical protein